MSTALEAASLIMIPTSYNDGLLASVKPNDGAGDFTFARCNGAAQCDLAATRVNSDGYIGKGYENLLLQSNTFNTTWLQTDLTATNGQSGYDGSNDAWLLNKSAANGRIRQYVTDTGIQTLSAYFKAGTNNWMRITYGGATTYFDLANGVLGSDNSIDATITSIGSGWYRCTFTANVTSAQYAQFYVADANGDTSGTTGSIYIQDAMLNQGMVAYPYVETTTASVAAGILEDMPRIDFSGGNQSLLLEPSRTNRCTFSEYFQGAAWLSIGSPTITTNYGISPEGVKNSTRIQFSGTNQCIYDGISYTSEEVSTIYVKGTSGETIKFGKGDNIFVGDIFTLDGTWQRLKFVQSVSGNTFTINTSSGATARDIEIWGAQNEEGSYPTSYIPTYGVSQTRLRDEVDDLSSPAVAGFTEFTWFFDNTGSQLDGAVKVVFQLVCTGTSLRYYSSQGGRFYAGGYFGEDNAIGKLCVKYNGTTLTMFKDGVKSASTINTNLGTIIYLDRLFTTDSIGTPIRLNQMSLFPTALSDEECIALTTI